METLSISEHARRVRENIQQVIVGKEEQINLALVAVLCEGHILIEDVPGIGKTTLAKALAKSLGCSFRRIQFTPDLLPSDVTGIHYFNQKQQEFELRPGPVFAQVILADEINRATPRTQSALLEAMQERQVTLDGETMPLPRPFLVLATQNPIELEGTFPLPEAQIDRFLIKLPIGYPSQAEENDILLRFEQSDPLADLATASSAPELQALQKQVREIKVEASLRNYIVAIARATREHEDVALGVSPRGTMALYHMAQAWAAIHNRSYVLPDDVKRLAPYVLTHRILIAPQIRLRGRRPEDIIAEVVNTIAVPVEA
jgi:MoxR-like ATPase